MKKENIERVRHSVLPGVHIDSWDPQRRIYITFKKNGSQDDRRRFWAAYSKPSFCKITPNGKSRFFNAEYDYIHADKEIYILKEPVDCVRNH